MKQRHLARLVALLVGAMGATAFGDDHVSGLDVDCSNVVWDCFDECLELKICLAVPENDGWVDCQSERSALASCEAAPGGGPGGGSGGGGVIIVTPPACPAGQHYNDDGECQGDHVCGDDEIGGGSEECEQCGEGEVPNHDGTACSTCEHGETAGGGTCNADPCGYEERDVFASTELAQYGREPKEHAAFLICKNGQIETTTWKHSTAAEACEVNLGARPHQACVGGPSQRADPCELSLIHTHPYFTEADRNVPCFGWPVGNEKDAIEYNDKNMEFSSGDLGALGGLGIEGHLGVSDRSCVRLSGYRAFINFSNHAVAGSCTPTPLPHVPWIVP